MQEYLAPQYMEILRWNASVVTPKHVKDIIGSIKMPFSRSSSLQLNCSKMRVVMRAIEGMSEGQAQPLVDKIVEKFAPWKSTTRCWRAGVWMIRVLATCPPGCRLSRGHLQEIHDDVLGSPWPSPEGGVGVREFRVGNARHRRRESRRIQGVDGLFYRHYRRKYRRYISDRRLVPEEHFSRGSTAATPSRRSSRRSWTSGSWARRTITRCWGRLSFTG